jgi:hypothetical protein
MKLKLFATTFLLFLLVSCNDKQTNPTTDIDVARAFIKDILENDFKDAKRFVLNDETNNQYFELSKKNFEHKTKEELKEFKEADIIINELNSVNDSVTIINYSNSYKKESKGKVKVVRVNGQWLVDLKYTFLGSNNKL